jgi:iron(III) transport system permease protein
VLAAIGGNLEEMAFSLGSSRANVFRTVTLPLALPGLANAFLLLFAASLADFADAADPRRKRVPGAADRSLSADHRPVRPQGRRRDVAAAAGPGALVYFVQRAWVERGYYVTISGKAGPQSTIPQRHAAGALAADPDLRRGRVLHRLSLRAAAARLAGRRVRRQPHLTLAHYRVIFTEGRKASSTR